MRYYIIAGEASGDLHGANLMRAIASADPNAEIRFWGGDLMKACGGTLVRHIRDLAFMGFVEVVSHLPEVLGNIRFCKQDILQFHPDVIVYVDYPGFNLKIAKFAHQHGFKNVHYISPQLWAWKKGRIKGMRRDLDKLCYILPFEEDFYAHNNFPQAVYVGHPLLDAMPQHSAGGRAERLVALLPGSRRQEVSRMLPAMLQLAVAHPEFQFRIAGMSLLGEDFYRPLMCGLPNVSICFDTTYELLSHADSAIVCSGTATLETALFNVPQVVCYRANQISVALARQFVGHRIKYISLVNLIADEPIVTELIQNDFSDGRLEHEFGRIVNNDEVRSQMLQGYDRVRNLLGGGGASLRTAQEIIKVAKGE